MATLVEIYTKSYCGYCKRALTLLNSKNNIVVKEIDVENDVEQEELMVKRANGRASVPQIFINNKHIGGCDDLYDLEKQGQLDKLLY